MWLFFTGLLILVLGYFFYGKFIERVIEPDNRATPAITHTDNVDFLELPLWKNMLIQLLNIAGVGPVIGVIIGIKFGSIAFLIIPIGNIIGGAVHDFISGMMSIRHRGANLPQLVKMMLGNGYARIFSWFMVLLLLLVVAVFINIPARLIAGTSTAGFWYAVAAVFVYYIVATLLPIDKIIGRIYPLFGGMLLLGSLAIFIALLRVGLVEPSLFSESVEFRAGMIKSPILPVLFVTIACGIISGFHATQSPIIARTIGSERHGLHTFSGMMVVEGIIAMIWAAAGMVIYNTFPELMQKAAPLVLGKITSHFLGGWLGTVTVISVIILAVTSGDTAMRSLRLSIAEMLGVGQRELRKRIAICLPLIIVTTLLLWWSNLSGATFGQLWNYFAWGNQVMAASTLFVAATWLVSLKKNWWIAVVPGMFMTFIVICYILWTSPKNGGPAGFGLPLNVSFSIAALAAVIIALVVFRRGMELRERVTVPISDREE